MLSRSGPMGLVLVLGLGLVLVLPQCQASSLGLSVRVVPLESSGGQTVRAHFTAIVPGPCVDISSVCSSGEDCLVQRHPVPYTGWLPAPGWCARQWQKTVPSHYSEFVSGLGTELYVSMNAKPNVRSYNNKLNRPAFAALPPPLRARVNCPRHFGLAVKDPDGDKVQCRFARPDWAECRDCIRHSFIQLIEDNCTLVFTGNAPAGQYFIHLMVEDFIPSPKTRYYVDNPPLSSVPLHLSLTVDQSHLSCSEGPLVSRDTVRDKSVVLVAPYQKVNLTVTFTSPLESVSEVAVVGAPDLFRVGFTSVGSVAALTIGWVRSEASILTQLLPVCFLANTQSLQSEPRCVWLIQRELSKLPPGTELKCNSTEMSLLLPLASLTDINLAELQLNSPSCPVVYNSTHLTAHISLDGCGTQTVHAGLDLVYTNTLRSVRPYTVIDRQPSLLFPLACRFPAVQVQGPHFVLDFPTERETFGDFRFWMETYPPGEGPMGYLTRSPNFRTNPQFESRIRRQVESEMENTTTRNSNGDRFDALDLFIMSDVSVERAELIIRTCKESGTMDFKNSRQLLDKGCLMSADLLEHDVSLNHTRIFRLDLSRMLINGTLMFMECVVSLCMATMPSDKCPNQCRNTVQSTLVNSVFTANYTIRSGPISIVRSNTTAPTTTSTSSTTATTTTTITSSTNTTTSTTSISSTNTTTSSNSTTTPQSQATKRTSSMTTGFIVTIVSLLLHRIY